MTEIEIVVTRTGVGLQDTKGLLLKKIKKIGLKRWKRPKRSTH